MLFSNANIFRPEGEFRMGSFSVENGCFGEICDTVYERADVDLGGKCVIPGVIDVHTHGNSGVDFSDGENYPAMLRYYASVGVTGVSPATMTLPVATLEKACRKAAEIASDRPRDCARLLGITMEGPFFSYNKRGAQNPDYLLNPDASIVRHLWEVSGGLVKIVCIAPELPGSMEFIEKVSQYCTVSIAHTEATYEEAREAVEQGATQLTHLFNGMPSIHHRKAGPIGAGSECDRVYAELICDGMHVSPSALRMAFKLFPGRICIISDSLACAGLPEGQYVSGGLPVFLKDHLCRLEDGTIAGSVCNAYEGMKNCVAFGIPREEAVLSATINPARQIGCADRVGSIETDKLADFVICEEDLTLRSVYIGGERI